MTACIVGWSHGKFGKLDGETSESLVVKAATDAIAHAGIEPRDIDVIYVGNMNGGFVRQEFHSSLALQAHPDLRFKPSTRVDWTSMSSSSTSRVDGLPATPGDLKTTLIFTITSRLSQRLVGSRFNWCAKTKLWPIPIEPA